MSLRLRFVALVVGAVALTLVALGLPGRRIALQEFEASVHAIVQDARVEEFGSPDGPLRTRDPEALAREVRATPPGERSVWITPEGRVRAADDPALDGMRGVVEADGSVMLERTTDGGLQRLRLGGGRAVTGPDGADLGRVFRFPASPEFADRGAQFSAALDRRLLGWAALIVAVGAVLALGLAGHALAPLRRLDTAARRIAAGDLGARVGGGGPPEIRAVAEAFDGMARHLEASEAARRRMIRDVAHDLRTPLTNLRGQIEALQDGLRALDAEALASLHEEAALLQRLVSDLDDLARADEGRLGLRLDDLDLPELIHAVVEGFVHSGRLPARGVTVALGDGPLRVRTDRAALGRALRNVLDNVAVHAPGAHVWIETPPDAAPVTFVVRDDGPGIAPEHRDRVTERLYRVDDARGRHTGGSGLGLAIALELVRAAWGDLAVEAAPGGGVAVRFRLPATGAQLPSDPAA